MDEIVYLNGSLIPRAEAKVPVMDYGFLFGFALFETMRAYNGKVFLLEKHLKRLEGSTTKLDIPIEMNLHVGVSRVIDANHLKDARVRITISAGEGTMVPDPITCHNPAILIMAAEYHPYSDEVYEKGFQAIVSSISRNSQSLLTRLKSANYMDSLLARQEAKAAGVDESICMNEAGFLAEGSTSNIFLVTRGVLRTPTKENGILPGITRETVLKIASSLGIKSTEHNINLNELFNADEAFFTNSLIEIMPLTRINGKNIAGGKPGAITRRLMAEYKKLVDAETTKA